MHGFEGPYDLYVGFDVGKRAHHAHAVLADGRDAFSTGVDNSEAAIDRVIADAAELGTPLVVVDQRRNIGMLAIRRARAAGVEVAYLPGISANRASSLFPGDAKTDARDAEVIARTAMGVPQSLRPVPEEDDLEGTRRLEAQRADLIKDRTHQVNRLRSLPLESNPDFERRLEPEAAWCIAVLERLGGPWNVLDAGRRRFLRAAAAAPAEKAESLWKSLGMATRPTEQQVKAETVLVPMIARRIREDTEQIEELERLIDEQVMEEETYQCLLTIPGIARRTATQLVLNVRIEDFADHDHLASYCGLTPRNRQSGTSLNSVSASRQGNKQLKNVLIFSCNSLLRAKGYFREYYDSCRFRGMTHKAALKATARKRMKVIYAVMRDRMPYREDALLRRQTL